MSKEKLREMLDATINEDTATAETAFHAYATDKFRVIMEEMDDENEPDADDFEDNDSDEDDSDERDDADFQ